MLAALQSACARHAERRGVSTRHATVVCALFGLALLARLLLFGVAPRGINQDEAYAAYEAWSLLHFGVDSWGYHNPVYLVAWGSGMNALETYLSMPLVALMGLNIMAVRIPQLVVSLCSVLCLEDLVLRATGSEREAEVAMGMLARRSASRPHG